jgi:hypothetical protein
MAYEIRFSDLTNKGTLVIEDATLNTETSLSLLLLQKASYTY